MVFATDTRDHAPAREKWQDYAVNRNVKGRRRELITVYTRRSGFYNITPCILSVCNALTVVFIQSRPNAPSQQKKVLKKRGLPAGTRKQSDNIADMAGNAKITVYTAKPIYNKQQIQHMPYPPAPRPLALYDGSGRTQRKQTITRARERKEFSGRNFSPGTILCRAE